jgi:pimeloyl-ACP methyl ester carboxylesterase
MSLADRRLVGAAPAPAAGFTSRWTVAAGDRIHVRERVASGSGGPTWLLVHGLAVSHRYLMPTATALPGTVYVPDLPGFGLSDKPRQVYDVAGHTAAVADLLDGLGQRDAYVLGGSFGCQVAVELAIRRPDLVAALVLVGPTVDPAAPTATGQVLRWLRDLAAEDPHQARMLAADVRDAGARRIQRTLRHSIRHPMPDRIPLVRSPILFLRGEHDPIASRRWIDQASASAADGHAGEVPRAAHNAVTTAGRQVAAMATAFTAAAGPRRGVRA